MWLIYSQSRTWPNKRVYSRRHHIFVDCRATQSPLINYFRNTKENGSPINQHNPSLSWNSPRRFLFRCSSSLSLLRSSMPPNPPDRKQQQHVTAWSVSFPGGREKNLPLFVITLKITATNTNPKTLSSPLMAPVVTRNGPSRKKTKNPNCTRMDKVCFEQHPQRKTVPKTSIPQYHATLQWK